MADQPPPPRRSAKSTSDAFRHAADGLMYCFKTQKHVPHYFLAIVVVLIAGIYLNISKLELLFVSSAILFVMLAEMLNTAVETIVDMISPEVADKARIAKDTAAAAVLVATWYAVSVTVVVFFTSERLDALLSLGQAGRDITPAELMLIGLVLLLLLVTCIKERSTYGTLLRGGVISGHAALAFFFATYLMFVMDNRKWAVFAYGLAFLVGQSRIEAKIHTVKETVAGGLVGAGIAVAVHMLGATVSLWQ